MKKTLLLIGCVAAALTFAYCSARADVQVVTINVLPEPTPKPVYRPVSDDIPEYKLNKNDVERIARLLWSSPLRSESEKVKLVWLVLNRVDAGTPFGTTIKAVVNDSEFTFFDRKARVSDKNRDIVENVMRLWMAEKEGYGVGRRPPKNALYCRFCGDNNRKVSLMSEPSGKALEW